MPRYLIEKVNMTKKSKNKYAADQHGAAVSGKFDKEVAIPYLRSFESEIINAGKGTTKKLWVEFTDPIVHHRFGVVEGRKHFIADGYSPLHTAWIEIKYLKQRSGTAQEKIYADYNKISYGVYAQEGKRLIYIFAGYMETDPVALGFKYDIEQKQKRGEYFYSPERLVLLDYSQITSEVWYNLFSTSNTALRQYYVTNTPALF
jgi:hypothetical protein